MRRSRRAELVETALALFQRHGFHATGIDRILADAGLAKQTLYHHFRGKEELIVAALRLRDERFRDEFTRRVEARAESAAGRLLAIFDVLAELAEGHDFCGCAFINACAEYADRDSPIHAVAADHKRRVADWVRELAAQAGARDPDTLGAQLCLLMDGAIVAAQVAGDASGARRGRQAARSLLADPLVGLS